MIDPNVLPAFLVAVALVTVAPGPDNLYISAVALARGPRAGVLSALGMSMGMVVHVFAAALGLAILLRSAPQAIVVVQLIGAGYLGWLSITALREASRPTNVPPDRRLVWRAALTNLTNPKVILFFAAFLPHFTSPGHGPIAVQLATLGLVFLLVGLLSDSLIGVSAGRLGKVLAADGRTSRILRLVSAAAFAVLALALLWDALLR